MNEDFTFDPDDDETFLEASAAFLRLGIGYMFGDRFFASIHAGYDYRPRHAMLFLLCEAQIQSLE